MIVEGRLRQLGTPERARRAADATRSSPRSPAPTCCAGTRDGHDDGLTTVAARERRASSTRPTSASGEVGVVVYPWEVSVGRVHHGRLGAEPDPGRDRLGRAGRQPRPRADRPAHRRGDRGLRRPARARARRDRVRLVQGDRDEARRVLRAIVRAREDPGHRRRGLHRLAPRPAARSPTATRSSSSTASSRRCTAASGPCLPDGVELIDGQRRRRRRSSTARSTASTAVVHLAAAVGVGQSMYEIAALRRENTMATATFLERLVARTQLPQRLVVASSMSIYGEGEYECSEHGAVAPGLRGEEQLLAREWECRCPECGARARAAADARDEAADPDLDLRDHEARPRGALPRDRRGLRDPDRRAALLQRLRPGPGALEPVHGRRGDLRVAAPERPAAGDLRGRPPVARLHPRERHRRGHRARARVGRAPSARRSTSARARRAPSTTSPGCSRTGSASRSSPSEPPSIAPATSATATRTPPAREELLGFRPAFGSRPGSASSSSGSQARRPRTVSTPRPASSLEGPDALDGRAADAGPALL